MMQHARRRLVDAARRGLASNASSASGSAPTAVSSATTARWMPKNARGDVRNASSATTTGATTTASARVVTMNAARRKIQGAAGAAFVGGVRTVSTASLEPLDTFERRHNSANEREVLEMCKVVGYENIDALIDATVPENIRLQKRMDMGEFTEPQGENEFLAKFKAMAMKNDVFKNYIGAVITARTCRR
jgi:glycine dehydrogenase